MDIKKKRKIIQYGVFCLGILLLIGLVSISNNGGLPQSLIPLYYCFFFPAAIAAQVAILVIPTKSTVFLAFYLTHLFSYLFLGWLVAQFIYPYPDKPNFRAKLKKLKENRKGPAEPTQD